MTTEPRKNLRAWREFRGLTQTEMAKRVGATKGEISRLEGGHRKLNVEWMRKFSEVLQISTDQLFSPPPVYRTLEDRLQAAEQRDAGLDFGLRPATARYGIYAVEGDEMQPTLCSGEAVVVDHQQTAPRPSGIFVIEQAGTPVTRRLQLVGDGTIRVSCDNRLYAAIDVDASGIVVTGRVIHRILRV